MKAESEATSRGTVYLVGAGPGDPDLLTVKAARLLAQADVVLHDDLAPRALLNLASRRALIVSVGKRCGRRKTSQPAIHELMIDSARRGLSVVRLQSGDPLIFGRAAEEMDALRSAGIPFEIVPGITAASAAAALVTASLTDRRVASQLIIMSGYRASGLPSDFTELPASIENATLAIYMPGSDLPGIARDLIHRGLPARTPCVLVSDASRPEAAYSAARLGELGSVPPATGPRLLLIGKTFEPVLARSAASSPLLGDVSEARASLGALF